MIKETAETVMQLLRILLTLLMNQVQTQVEEQAEQLVPNEHALQLQTLMQEVRGQKATLQEISKNLKTGGNSPTHHHPASEWSEEVSEKEIHIWEDEMQLFADCSKTVNPSSPPRQMQVPMIASLPKTPSRAAPAGTSGVRSPQIETPKKPSIARA